MPGAPYTQHEMITDATGLLQVSIPAVWTDLILDGPFEYILGGPGVGPAMNASPNVATWRSNPSLPGLFMAASDQLGMTVREVIDDWFDGSGICDYHGQYDDDAYVGEFDQWSNCGEEGSDFIVLVTEPHGGGAIVLIEVSLVTEADIEALDMILQTFRLTGG